MTIRCACVCTWLPGVTNVCYIFSHPLQHCVAVAVKCPEGQPGSLPTFTERSVSELLCQLTPLTSPDPAHWTVFSGKAAHPTIV